MTVKTFNVEPHWPGMLRWLEHVARCALGELGGVAITGGMDTALYAVTESGALYEFDHGEWYPKDDYTDWATVFDVAYCTKVGDVIIVAGEEVK